MGQEEELRLYNESPCDDMDPRVTEELMNLGFEWDQIQDSLKSKRYNSMMTMYLILSTKKSTRAGHTFLVRPFGSPDLNMCGPSPTEEGQPEFPRFCQADEQPEDQESGPANPPPSLD